MGARLVRMGFLGLATALALAACGDDDGTDTGGATGSIEGIEHGLGDGVHFGYLRDYVAGHNEIVGTFDPAELLTGDEALAATEEEGDEEPLDYFIRNTDDRERIAIVVDPEAQVLDIPYGTDDCCDPKASTPARFGADREANSEEQTIVELTVEDGAVKKLEEIYFP